MINGMNIPLPFEHFTKATDLAILATRLGLGFPDLRRIVSEFPLEFSCKMIIAQEAGVVCWELPGCGALNVGGEDGAFMEMDEMVC